MIILVLNYVLPALQPFKKESYFACAREGWFHTLYMGSRSGGSEAPRIGEPGWTQNRPCIHRTSGSGVAAGGATWEDGYAMIARPTEYRAASLAPCAYDY